MMYQYSNSAYNNHPSSTENLPHRRLRYDGTPQQDQTVGIGYYGASRSQQSNSHQPTTANMSKSPGMFSLSSPASRDETSNPWEHMQANVDLSPPNSRSRLNGSNIKSPVRPLSEGSMIDAYNRSRFSVDHRQGSNSVPLLGHNEHSPQSTDQSNPSFTLYPRQNTPSMKNAVLDKPPMSLREKWENSRKHGDDDFRNAQMQQFYVNRSNLSSASVNQSHKDITSPNISRQSDGDTLVRSLYSQGDTEMSPHSTIEREYNTYSTSSSLRRDPLSHRKLPNGNVKPVQDGSINASRRSLNISRLSLRSQSGKVTLYGKGYGVHNSLVNMGLAALLSLIMCFLCTQLLFRVAARESMTLVTNDSVLRTNTSHANVSEVVVALTSIAIMLDLCCLLTCVLQGYFAAKLMKCKDGEERAFRYLKECMPTRFIAIIGFFVSIPAFFFGLMLYIIMEYRSTPAIIAVVILTIGVSFCISMAMHSTYIWFNEKSNANKNIFMGQREPNNNKTKLIHGELTNQNELSTLV